MLRCLYAPERSPFLLLHYTSHVSANSGWRLELGAGGGLVGLAVALGCAVDAPVHITDQLDMFPLMVKNIALNGLESRVVPLVLNW
jgi:tRNA1(Val) A37 N6-methylase TrmN6